MIESVNPDSVRLIQVHYHTDNVSFDHPPSLESFNSKIVTNSKEDQRNASYYEALEKLKSSFAVKHFFTKEELSIDVLHSSKDKQIFSVYLDYYIYAYIEISEEEMKIQEDNAFLEKMKSELMEQLERISKSIKPLKYSYSSEEL